MGLLVSYCANPCGCKPSNGGGPGQQYAQNYAGTTVTSIWELSISPVKYGARFPYSGPPLTGPMIWGGSITSYAYATDPYNIYPGLQPTPDHITISWGVRWGSGWGAQGITDIENGSSLTIPDTPGDVLEVQAIVEWGDNLPPMPPYHGWQVNQTTSASVGGGVAAA